ncbi:hypothetical protein BD410DRAFT_783711 [Rickenella mellea]|uniref:BTB domain-containing protein n=1 Tax=Rickenella mellea TaxID=50990 RepID=A0A4Y7QHP0_9AGAM|nr:hypothetical protein BD410DRAFT_783711 [Rickenella mellea]
MAEMEADNEDWHPSYSSSNTDLVLISDDGIKFRVHSIVLAPASKFFRDMFRMPRPAMENNDDALPMGESSEIVKTILDIIYPHDVEPVLPSTTFAFVRRLLSAAERFELMRVNHYVRLITLKEPFVSRPLEVYALACTFGWAEEVRTQSLRSLNVDLSSPDLADILKSIDSASLYNLFQLRWKRKGKVLLKIDEYEDANGWICDCQFNTGTSMAAFDHLRALICEEMDKCPDGSSLQSARFWNQAGPMALWDSRCSACDVPVLDESNVKGFINQALDKIVKEDMKC